LPEKLLKKADVMAEIMHRNRTELMKEALRDYLGKFESDEEFKEKVVELYLDEELEFEELKTLIGNQDAESVKATAEVLNSSEEKSDGLAEIGEA